MKANLLYDSSSGGYSLKFDIESKYDKSEWAQLKLITGAIKGIIPTSDRDYDTISKVWFFHEKHLQTLKILLENAVGKHNLFVMEKPTDQPSSVFISLDTDITKFLNYVGAASEDDIKDFDKARKLYRKAAMKYHPDRNANGAADMSALNECWSRLQRDYYKKELTNA